jgi:hypothetical protein
MDGKREVEKDPVGYLFIYMVRVVGWLFVPLPTFSVVGVRCQVLSEVDAV